VERIEPSIELVASLGHVESPEHQCVGRHGNTVSLAGEFPALIGLFDILDAVWVVGASAMRISRPKLSTKSFQVKNSLPMPSTSTPVVPQSAAQ
jgi:hypothetical protein